MMLGESLLVEIRVASLSFFPVSDEFFTCNWIESTHSYDYVESSAKMFGAVQNYSFYFKCKLKVHKQSKQHAYTTSRE